MAYWIKSLTYQPIKKILMGACLLVGGLLVTQSGWIHVKALLAQKLIQQAWQQTLVGDTQVKPWPWADTWPVGRLEVDSLNVDLYILQGAQGSALAFGPAYLIGSAEPGADGTSIIAGHRDTHFQFMEDLQRGALLQITDHSGGRHRYRVETLVIVDSRDQALLAPSDDNQLILITCYPFNAINTGGPLRYVVRAIPEEIYFQI